MPWPLSSIKCYEYRCANINITNQHGVKYRQAFADPLQNPRFPAYQQTLIQPSPPHLASKPLRVTL